MTGHAEAIVGFNVPAEVGMPLQEVATPALLIDLDAFERNVKRMADFVGAKGVRLRAHAKTHRSADIALYQIEHGGACGICCQKVAEAEALIAGGVRDVLVSNQVVDPPKIDRLARMARTARTIVCVDDAGNVETLSAAAAAHGVTLECLVEVDCGAGRCGVDWGLPAVELAEKIAASSGLVFSGLQAYQGSAQHVRNFAERKALIDKAAEQTAETVHMLKARGLDCDIVGGAGTGSYPFETASGVYNELQCGSYIFMDADYARVRDEKGEPVSDFESALFVWTQVMSHVRGNQAVCDAGLKVMSAECGLPRIDEPQGLVYESISDEHGVISDPKGVLKLGDKLKLVPGHCDPTCNLHDFYVGVRGDRVECLWPVTARGLSL